MMAALKTKRILFVLGGVSALTFAWIVINFVRNPMDARLSRLEAEIDDIQVVPLFIVGPSETDYTEIQQVVTSNTTLWRQLIAPPKQAPPKDPGPNFQQLLTGVAASTLEIQKNGKPMVKITTPAAPRGRWVGVGDQIAGANIVQITPQHIVISMSKGGKDFKHNIPRQ